MSLFVDEKLLINSYKYDIVTLCWGLIMTKRELEKKVKHLKKEIDYYKKVFPKSEKLAVLKSSYRHYKRLYNI